MDQDLGLESLFGKRREIGEKGKKKNLIEFKSIEKCRESEARKLKKIQFRFFVTFGLVSR